MADDHGPHVSISAKEIRVCQHFPEKHLPCMLKVADEIDYKPGQSIVIAGESASVVFIIARGIVRAMLTSPRQAHLTAVVDMLGPGDLYGLTQAIDKKPYLTGLEAVTETRVLAVRAEDLLLELDRHPETSRNLLDQLAAQVRTYQEWVISQM